MEMPRTHVRDAGSSPRPESLVTEVVDAENPPGAGSYASAVGEIPDVGGAVGLIEVDWSVLRETAADAAARAYSPYSGLRVGAAALVDDGRTVLGCNVENASYGVTLCAECALAGQLRLTGGGRLVAVACRSAAGEPLAPCGRCRQILHELGGPELLVDMPQGIRRMREVLPDAFTL